MSGFGVKVRIYAWEESIYRVTLGHHRLWKLSVCSREHDLFTAEEKEKALHSQKSRRQFVTLAGKIEATVVLCGLQGYLPFFWNLPVLPTTNLEHDLFPQSQG